MTDEIIERLEKGCGKEFRDSSWNAWKCGIFDLAFCPICKARIEQHQQSTEAERKRILEILWIDNFRSFSFSSFTVQELLNQDDNTGILIEILEEIKDRINEAVKE